MTQTQGNAELREKIEVLNSVSSHACYCKRSLDDGCTCALKDEYIDEIMGHIDDFVAAQKLEARKATASEIFNLAHEYASNDDTMIGSEELRAYHYYNAIHKIGEFSDR